MSAIGLCLHLLTLLLLPIVFVGLLNRTKSMWAGRKGPPVLQLLFDLRRLLRKHVVYSSVTTPLFFTVPYVLLGTSIVAGMIVPLLGESAPVSFAFDFIFMAYLWGLGRVAMILGALDTGSSFEGMGASREATFAALAEPALFLVVGALGASIGQRSLSGLLHLRIIDVSTLVTWMGCAAALFVVLQVESARIPVDDPSTHLELTMIHEVMLLDHSGPDLAALQYGAAIKMTTAAALLATLLNPVGARPAPVCAMANLAITLGLAVLIGSVESLIARIKLRAIPQYALAAVVAAFVALLSSNWRSGGGG